MQASAIIALIKACDDAELHADDYTNLDALKAKLTTLNLYARRDNSIMERSEMLVSLLESRYLKPRHKGSSKDQSHKMSSPDFVPAPVYRDFDKVAAQQKSSNWD